MRWILPVLVSLSLTLSVTANADIYPAELDKTAPIERTYEPLGSSLTPDAGVRPQPEAPAAPPPVVTAPRPMPLPYKPAAATASPTYYYEGESCSGSGGYYDDGYSDGCSGSDVGTSGDDDDDDDTGTAYYAGDDDDSTSSPPSSGDDDDDDDSSDVDIEWGDDDDDDDELDLEQLKTRELRKLGKRDLHTRRPQSPFSRLALLGVLVAFPLRRRFRSS